MSEHCCEVGELMGISICPECQFINDGYQSCLGIGPEEIARRNREQATRSSTEVAALSATSDRQLCLPPHPRGLA